MPVKQSKRAKKGAKKTKKSKKVRVKSKKKKAKSKSKRKKQAKKSKPALKNQEKDLIEEFRKWQLRQSKKKPQKRRQKKPVKKEYVKSFYDLPDPLKFATAFIVICMLIMGAAGAVLALKLVLNTTKGDQVTIIEASGKKNSTQIKENISRILKDIIESTTTTAKQTTVTSTTSSTLEKKPDNNFVCNSPYIQVGSECCLDRDSNNICDRDEETTTSTTVSDIVRCETDSDCGPTRVEHYCDQNRAKRKTVTFFCNNPATKSSMCEMKTTDELLEVCPPDKLCTVKDDTVSCKNRYASNNLYSRSESSGTTVWHPPD